MLPGDCAEGGLTLKWLMASIEVGEVAMLSKSGVLPDENEPT